MTRARYRCVLLASACMASTGCAFWPTMKADKEVQAPDPQEWACYSGNQDADDSTDNLNKARGCALSTLDEFNGLLGNAAKTDRSMSYALWGLGTWAGVRAIDEQTDDEVLRNIAISVAALLGLREVVGTADQRRILEQGITAIQCVVDAADAVAFSASLLEGSDSQQALDSALSAFSSSSVAQSLGVQDQPEPSANEVISALSILGRTQIQPIRALETRITSSHATLALELGAAVQQIRQAVRTELSKSSPDPTTVLDAQRKRVETMVRGISSSGEQADESLTMLRTIASTVGIALNLKSLESVVIASSPPRNVRERCAFGSGPE